MQLEELVNQYYDDLNENDLMIWKYILANKQECCEISIEELSKRCSISRATISRFTQKISFDGFREFKMRLKLECQNRQVENDGLLEEICNNYSKNLELTMNSDFDDLFSHIHNARRLFVFGTGETQNAVADMIKRVFLQAKVFFVTLYGKSELKMTIDDLNEEDLMIFISVSGENEMAIDAMKRLKSRGTYLVSITKLNNNTLARLADKSLYVITDQFSGFINKKYETTSSYFNTIEVLFIKYLKYLENSSKQKD